MGADDITEVQAFTHSSRTELVGFLGTAPMHEAVMDSSSYDTQREEREWVNGRQGQATSFIDIVTPIWDLEMTYREILEIK